MNLSKKRRRKKSRRGFFITFEGVEGSGKSTHIKRLAQFLKNQGMKVIATKEPGGTPIGEEIRKILLNPNFKNLTGKTELFLLMADRSQHIEEKIVPYLNKGYVVISDRYADSSVAYQGGGRAIDVNFIKKLNTFATDNTIPDLTILMDFDIKMGLQFARNKNDYKKGDRIEQESLAFHKRVHDEYYRLAEEYKDRFVIIKKLDKIEDTEKEIREIVINKMKEKGYY